MGYGRPKVYVPTDPNITVYVAYRSPIRADNGNAVGQGHFYIQYSSRGLPDRLSAAHELRLARYGVNPEIYMGFQNRSTTADERCLIWYLGFERDGR